MASLDELLLHVKANWLRGLPRHENIADLVTRFESLNGDEERVQQELDYFYYGDFHFTDMGNAQRLVRLFGSNLRYSIRRRKWLVWVGANWQWDDEVLVVQYAKRVVKALYEQASKEQDDASRASLAKWALTSESTSRLMAMVKSAESEEAIQISDDDVDSDPYLFNVKNGTVNLTTGQLQPHNKEDYITKVSPVSWDLSAPGEQWQHFLSDVTGDNADLTEYLARAVGYSLTGNAQEDIVFFVYGPGGNGKSTFLSTIHKLMGDYAGTVPVKAIIASSDQHSGHRDEIASLVGTRMVLGAETPERMKIDMGLIKALTGGDAIAVSRKYERTFTFRPTFKPWLYGNSKPRIPEIDDGTWRRLRLVPFLAQFKRGENEVADMEERLEKELPAILKWAVEGAVKWREFGLTDVDVVAKATSEYRAEEDVVGQFIDDCCEHSTAWRVAKASMYERYKQWCEENGENPLGTRTFTLRLRAHGLRELKSGSVRYWDAITFGKKGTDGADGADSSEKSTYEETKPDFCDSAASSVPTVPCVASVPGEATPPSQCSCCGGTRFWRRSDGEWVCGECHPDPNER